MFEKTNSKSSGKAQESIVVKEELDRFGNGTGHHYYKCQCGAELMTGQNKDKIPHTPGCPEADQ